MNKNLIIFLILGTLLIWLGLNGRLGVFLASLFTPTLVKTRAEEGTEETVEEMVSAVSTASSNLVSLPSTNAPRIMGVQ